MPVRWLADGLAVTAVDVLEVVARVFEDVPDVDVVQLDADEDNGEVVVAVRNDTREARVTVRWERILNNGMVGVERIAETMRRAWDRGNG